MLKKKILGSLLITGISFAGISFALEMQQTTPFIYTAENSDITIDDHLNFNGPKTGIGMIKIPSNYTREYYFWRDNGKIYTYNNINNWGATAQGYFTNYGITNTEPNSIYDVNMNLPIEDFYAGQNGTSFNKIKVFCYANNYQCRICAGNSNEYYCFGSYMGENITGSKNYTFTTTQEIIDSINPGTSVFNGGNGGGTGQTTNGGTLYCPPIKYEIDMYGNNYNTGLCYSNTEEITGGQVINTTPINIFEAFPTYQNYVQAYNLIQQNCHTDTVNTVEQCQTALQSIGKKPAEILLKLINSNIPQGTSIAKVYQYCHLQLNYTEEEKRNTSTCDLKENGTFYATGVTQNNSSNPNTLEGLTEALQESDQTIVIPEDGTIFDDMLPDGIISRKDAILNIDLRSTRTQLTIKIMGLFKTRPIVEGMLPPIMTSLLLLIVLFKIFKK